MSKENKKGKQNKKEKEGKKEQKEETIFKDTVTIGDWIKAGIKFTEFIPEEKKEQIPSMFLTWKMGIKMANAAIKSEIYDKEKITTKTPAREALQKIMEGMKSSFL